MAPGEGRPRKGDPGRAGNKDARGRRAGTPRPREGPAQGGRGRLQGCCARGGALLAFPFLRRRPPRCHATSALGPPSPPLPPPSGLVAQPRRSPRSALGLARPTGTVSGARVGSERRGAFRFPAPERQSRRAPHRRLARPGEDRLPPPVTLGSRPPTAGLSPPTAQPAGSGLVQPQGRRAALAEGTVAAGVSAARLAGRAPPERAGSASPGARPGRGRAGVRPNRGCEAPGGSPPQNRPPNRRCSAEVSAGKSCGPGPPRWPERSGWGRPLAPRAEPAPPPPFYGPGSRPGPAPVGGRGASWRSAGWRGAAGPPAAGRPLSVTLSLWRAEAAPLWGGAALQRQRDVAGGWQQPWRPSGEQVGPAKDGEVAQDPESARSSSRAGR